MPYPLFGIPLNLGTGTWVVTIISGLSFLIMFGLASAGGDFQGLINTTLKNDALAREKRQKNKLWSVYNNSQCSVAIDTLDPYVSITFLLEHSKNLL